MTNVITQIEMMKFDKMEKAIFPLGTIVTPSAKDWAVEHHIEVIIGENSEKKDCPKIMNNIEMGKPEYLKHIIKTVITNVEKTGGLIKKEDITEIVTRSLQKLGCKVE